MTHIRRRLPWVLATWLVFQVLGLATPIAWAAAGHAGEEELCTCVVMDHATCPMHSRQAPSRDDDGRCRMRSAAPSSDVLILALTGGTGIVVDRAAFDRVDPRGDVMYSPAVSRPFRTDLPDSPPPRA
jgi:hypothetical protein